MNFKNWLKINEIHPPTIGMPVGLPSDKNAEWGRKDVGSKYVSSAGTGKLPPVDEPEEEKSPADKSFGFNSADKKQAKKNNSGIHKYKPAVPPRVPTALT